MAACLAQYDRDHYPHWKSTPESKSAGFKNVRELVIAKSVVSDLVVRNGRVVGGKWHDFYTGLIYDITKVTPDIDHIVSLNWAHDRGGECATLEQREAFANDISNMWAVHPSTNRSKGNRVSSYLPPNLAICPAYLAQIKKVLSRHQWIKPLSVDKKIYAQAAQKCEQVKRGILINRESNWFKRLFKTS